MKTLIALIGITGFLAVALGAFGAHGLASHMSEEQRQWFTTANRYHFYHLLASLLMYVWYLNQPQDILMYAVIAFLIGILLFSGSLYLMATHSFLGIPRYAWLGPITPLGGLLFLLGWILVLWSGIRSI